MHSENEFYRSDFCHLWRVSQPINALGIKNTKYQNLYSPVGVRVDWERQTTSDNTQQRDEKIKTNPLLSYLVRGIVDQNLLLRRCKRERESNNYIWLRDTDK